MEKTKDWEGESILKSSDNSKLVDFLRSQNFSVGNVIFLDDIYERVAKINMVLKADDPHHAIREAFNYLSEKGYIEKISPKNDGQYRVIELW